MRSLIRRRVGKTKAPFETVPGTRLESFQKLKVIMNELLMKKPNTGKN
jgi:hypothetical protein